MNVQNVGVELIDANPWQPRLEDDAAHAQAVAESIRERGLLQVPLGRRLNGRVQLAFGHTRLAAWRIAKTGEPFPVDLRELSDREMSDLAAEENTKRKNLTAIEIARAIQRRMSEFGLTPTEAGKPFGYDNAATVTNLLRLLKLPEPIRAQVHSGEMPERIARMLLPVARIAPQKVVDIAERALKKEPGDREDHILAEFDDILQKKGLPLNSKAVRWDHAWPKTPFSAEKYRNESEGEPAEIRACAGCENYVKTSYRQWCTCVPCYRLKQRVFPVAEAERASRATGLAVGSGKREEYAEGAYIFGENGGRVDYEFAGQVVRLKKAQSLLFLHPLLGDNADYPSQGITGSAVVQLATTDLNALKALVRELDKANRAPKREDSDDVKRPQPGESASARQEKEMRARQKEWRERSRVQAENERLLAAASKVLCAAIPKGGLLDALVDMAMAADWLDLLGIPRVTGYGGGRAKKLSTEERRLLVMSWILDERTRMTYRFGESHAKVRKEIEVMAASLRMRLKKGWDAIEATPHAHRSNCWLCGCTRDEYGRDLGEMDIKRGWVVLGDLQGPECILCPECAVKTENGLRLPAWAKEQ